MGNDRAAMIVLRSGSVRQIYQGQGVASHPRRPTINSQYCLCGLLVLSSSIMICYFILFVLSLFIHNFFCLITLLCFVLRLIICAVNIIILSVAMATSNATSRVNLYICSAGCLLFGCLCPYRQYNCGGIFISYFIILIRYHSA